MSDEQKNPLKDAEELFGLDLDCSEEIEIGIIDDSDLSKKITNEALKNEALSQGMSIKRLYYSIKAKERELLERGFYENLKVVIDFTGVAPDEEEIKHIVKYCFRESNYVRLEVLGKGIKDTVLYNYFTEEIKEIYNKLSDISDIQFLYRSTSVKPDKMDEFFMYYKGKWERKMLDYVVRILGVMPSQDFFDDWCIDLLNNSNFGELEYLVNRLKMKPSDSVREDGYDKAFLKKHYYDLEMIYEVTSVLPSEGLLSKYSKKFINEGDLVSFDWVKKKFDYEPSDEVLGKFLDFLK